MHLNLSTLRLLSECAISAAYQAGHFIKRRSQEPISVSHKAGKESLASQVVTEVDQMAQEIILKILQPTCEQFDLALLAEESEDNQSRFEKDYFWCIDPLDGTLSFTEQTPGFSVSISLISKEGESMIGVIYDPVKETLYHALKGEGAFRNGELWQANAPQGNQNLQNQDAKAQVPLTIMADRSFFNHSLFTKTIEYAHSLVAKFGYSGLSTRFHGGGAMNAMWVLERGPAFYLKYPSNRGGSLWDFGASACIAKEFGALVCDLYGGEFELNRKESTYMNHKGILYSSHRALGNDIMEFFEQQEY
ncbi:MAG: inositol monophosphatase [Planctomycetes bacterium]|nr:inositol monophosphatase [Planctomycetota bacterium]